MHTEANNNQTNKITQNMGCLPRGACFCSSHEPDSTLISRIKVRFSLHLGFSAGGSIDTHHLGGSMPREESVVDELYAQRAVLLLS